MIPPLVALIAAAEDHEHHATLDAVLQHVRDSDRVRSRDPWDELPESLRAAAPRQIAALPIRKLVPAAKQQNLGAELLSLLKPNHLVSKPKNTPDVISLAAGLWMVHDHLDECHELAQAADDAGRNSTAAYWHGIVHRREPDYDNARYWFRRVRSHPIFESVGAEVARWLDDPRFASRLGFDRVVDRRGSWNPKAFIDLCAQCGEVWNDQAEAAARLQEIEMRLLLQYTVEQATG